MHLTHASRSLSPVNRRTVLPVLVLLLTALVLGLRVWHLNTIPPSLWWDEATQGLDAAELLSGHFRIFYPSALGKEPLYIYLTAPFVAAWPGSPFAVRLAGALLSALMVPALYATGRALFIRHPTAGTWAGLTAAILWGTNFWAQSISRIGFQVNAFPLLLTVAVLTWLNYTHRPDRRRALTFGIVAGLTLYTYLAARATPVLWLALYLLLPRAKRIALRPTLTIAILAFIAVILPLGIHFALHPADFFSRISTFDAVQGGAAEPEPWSWSIEGTLKAFFGIIGDPIARHNLPDQPSFTPVAVALFALGLVTGLLAILLRSSHKQAALTALVWWVLLCIPAILSRSSTPHYPRLYGALPAAMLIAALPTGFAVAHHRVLSIFASNDPQDDDPADRYRLRVRSPRCTAWMTFLLAALLAGLLVSEAVHTAQAYFVRWARETDLYTYFQQDLWAIAEQISESPGAVGVVPLNPEYGKQLDYAFEGAPIFQLPAGEGDVASWLDARLGQAAGQAVVAVVWGEGANQDADPKQLLPFYLAREGSFLGTRSFRGFDLQSYRLGAKPQFTAQGQAETLSASFEPGLTLVATNWGAAYPNTPRSGTSVAAGTALWAVLTWQLDQAQPELRTAVDLLDAAGHRLASAEAPLMDLAARQRPWQPGAALRTYYLIPVPDTQPPGPVTLAARVYDMQTQAPVLLLQLPETTCAGCTPFMTPIARATVTPSLAAPAPEIARPLDIRLSSGVTLLGSDGWLTPVAPGQLLSTWLYWRVDEPSPAARSFRITLGKTASSAETQVPANLVLSAVVHTHADLRVPPEAAEGAYTLLLEDLQQGDQAELGPVQVGGRPHTFQAPSLIQPLRASFGSAVELQGVDAPPSVIVEPGQVVTVTLAWTVTQPPPTDLARFVHVLGSDGRPVTQRAGVPCAGQVTPLPDAACPAASWIGGEVLIDRVEIEIPATLPPGRYPLATGWYDAATLQRIPARNAQGEAAPDDLFRLPVELVVGG